ncbi:MAG: hypothetical protein WB392_06400 [Methanotrichaceae archaeon]
MDDEVFRELVLPSMIQLCGYYKSQFSHSRMNDLAIDRLRAADEQVRRRDCEKGRSTQVEVHPFVLKVGGWSLAGRN